MTFARRVRLYFVGILLGTLSVVMIFRNRGCRMMTPGTVKLDQLAIQTRLYSDSATCLMKCEHIDTAAVQEIFYNGKINFKASKEFAKPHPSYAIDGITKKGDSLRVYCIDNFDSITRVLYVQNLKMKNENCGCK
ncbi:MAG: DUF4258 domain-containing protein [Bacteroidia bacterium]